MLKKSRFYGLILLIILCVLSTNTLLYLFTLENISNSSNDEISSINSSATLTIFADTPYGGIMGSGSNRDENNYFEWAISTTYGPGLTFYMFNYSQFQALLAMNREDRIPGSFEYTALLSDEESSASGTFYPAYSDQWWFVAINHYTGYDCQVVTTENWNADSITVDVPTSSSLWESESTHYINWTWGGDFSYVNIDLYYDGVFFRNIATNVQNDGSYQWIIPSDLSFDDLYQINISNTNYAGTWGISDAYFEIEGMRSINITNPIASSLWRTETSEYINWTSAGLISNVMIELYENNIFAMEIISSTINDGEYYWSIPSGLVDSDKYQIKISDVSDPSLFNFSDYFEMYTSDITITNPISSSLWETGTSQYINWTSTGPISNVKIELYNNDGFVMEIIPSTLDNSEHYWAIPFGLLNSDKYQIKISDVSDPSVYVFSDYFEIFTFTLTITNPLSSSLWETGTSQYINWTSTGPISNVKIDLYNNDIFAMEINPNTINNGEYYWTIPSGLMDSDKYQIKITDASNSSLYDFSDYFEIFTFTLTITNPLSSSLWEKGTSQYINWTSTGPISSVLIELYNDGVFVIEIIPSTPNDGEFFWMIPSSLSDSNKYQIKITDASNSSLYDFSDYFEIREPSSNGQPVIPGYNLFIILGVIGLSSPLFVKKRYKK